MCVCMGLLPHHLSAPRSKNVGHGYRQEFCRRLGLPTTEAMLRLDGRMREKRKAAREARGTHTSKSAKLRKKLHNADRNVKGTVKPTYETGGDLDTDCFGKTIAIDDD
ncbi:hypothetical protein CYMTET_21766 [Cymbomonas tetramitiformis]|uniref:Uncharacterized protein n=1 Tax=Cymbomonas tetramitiformis TaxID=36881 RepID=A0AAE0G1D0_9CHLO|nr:hypothetical protein CYMTET_21766 [Cymbomonas tetramitiformis]